MSLGAHYLKRLRIHTAQYPWLCPQPVVHEMLLKTLLPWQPWQLRQWWCVCVLRRSFQGRDCPWFQLNSCIPSTTATPNLASLCVPLSTKCSQAIWAGLQSATRLFLLVTEASWSKREPVRGKRIWLHWWVFCCSCCCHGRERPKLGFFLFWTTGCSIWFLRTIIDLLASKLLQSWQTLE